MTASVTTNPFATPATMDNANNVTTVVMVNSWYRTSMGILRMLRYGGR